VGLIIPLIFAEGQMFYIFPATMIKYLRRTTSGAAGNGLGTTIKFL
jgi:hypothetical protein